MTKLRQRVFEMVMGRVSVPALTPRFINQALKFFFQIQMVIIMKNLFHYAFPVDDLDAARQFYGGLLGCSEGRSSEILVDFNLYGHQIVAHKVKDGPSEAATNPVDKDHVPVPHFGLVLQMEDWKDLARRLTSKGVKFVIEPKIRFEGEIGEQATMFLMDPAGNALEFKGFDDFENVFASE